MRIGSAAALALASLAALPARGARLAALPARGAEPPAAEDEQPAPRYESVVRADAYDPAGTSARTLRRADLERQGAGSIAEALERTPSCYATTGTRGERLLTIRGFEQRQLAVLVDGAPAALAYDGALDLGMVPAELVEQVQLARGPGTGLFGGGLGPTLSLTTRPPGDGPLASARLEAGTPGAWRLGALHARRRGPVGYTLWAGTEKVDAVPLPAGFAGTPLQPPGRRANSDRTGWHAGGAARWEPGAGHTLSLSASYLDGHRGVPPSTVDDTPRFWRFGVWRGLALTASHRWEGAIEIEPTIYARLFDNRLDGYDDATYTSQGTARAFRSWHHDRSFGLLVRTRIPLPEIRGVGSELRATLSAGWDRHTEGEGGPALQRATIAAAPELELSLGSRLGVTLGGQLEAELPVDFPGERLHPVLGFGPLLALRAEPAAPVSLGLTAARRTRFPSLKERFARGFGTRRPNPDLGPESAWQLGLEASWRAARWLSLDASLFDAEVSGLIDRVALGGGEDQLQNLRRARLAGAELAARVRVLPWLRGEAGWAWLHARRLDDGGGELAYRPAHRGSLGLVASALGRLELSTFVRLVGPQRYAHPLTRAWGTLGAYAVWDAQLEGRPHPGVAVLVRATNLLDSSFQTEIGFPDPGRRLWAGLRLTFDGPEEPIARLR